MSNYKYVNTKMGTFNCERYSNGNCYPVCAVPHGMNFFTLQTNGNGRGWFYSPLDKSFEGICLTHMPSPWLSDYGRLLIWGECGDLDEKTYFSSFDNNKAVIEPAYINLSLHKDRYSIELSPTNSAVIIRMKFTDDAIQNRIVFSSKAFSHEFDEKTGFLYISNRHYGKNSYFGDDKENSPVEHVVIKINSEVKVLAKGDKVSLNTNEKVIECKLATSYISKEQAMLNLEREVLYKELEEVKREAENEWEEYLSRIEIEDGDEDKKSVFYSCMYRAFLWPRRFYEIDKDGNPKHLDAKNNRISDGYLFVDNGFWDTYRTLYPYLSLIDMDIYSKMAEGFYNHYKNTGWLPKWLCPHNVNCMPGMLIEATMSDAIVKNIVTGELAENIFRAMLKDGEYESEIKGEGRVQLSVYRKYGYYPYTAIKESVNETLDNSYGDFAIAMAAKKLGYDDIAEKYFGYSQNYRKLFDKDTGFIRGKDEYGKFRDEVFNPYMWGRDYTEGSAWQNAFGVYHDIKGLDELYEGKLQDKIDELMKAPPCYYVGSYGRVIHEMAELAMADCGQCAISNQPSFHIPYIYSELGNPKKTSECLEKLLELFNSGIEGYPGDEDNGSMSCWYILSAMGLYQVAPSRPDFATAVPLFEKMRIRLSNGNILEINKNEYDADKMNGKVSYFDIMKGGKLSDIVCKK